MSTAADRSREPTLRRRLLLALLALSLVPLFGSNAVGYLRSRLILEELVQRYLDGLAEVQALHVEGRLDQRRRFLEAIASGNRFLEAAAERGGSTENPGMSAAAGPAAVADYLDRQVAESGEYTSMALLDEEGRLFASSRTDSDPSVWSGSDRSEPAPALTLLRSPDGDHPPTLRFTVPVTDASGVPVAYLGATISLAEAVGFLDIPPHVAGSIESIILDEARRPVFVSHQHGHLDFGRPFASPLATLPAGRHARYRDREGVDVMGSSAALPRYSWLFITEIPASDALGELRQLRTLSLLLSGILTALVVGTALLLARRIVAPVSRLVEAARTLGAGDLEVRVPAEGSAEIAELGGAFNDMASELASNQERIKLLHRREIERAGQLATVGELASGLAHEIKNPVVGISNGLDLVLRRVDEPELQPIADEMRRQLTRIEGAIRDLLSFARPREPRFAPTAVVPLLERAMALVEPGAQKGGVALRLDSREKLPPIHGDAELLNQAVVNLLVNAVAFSPAGETVFVRAYRQGDQVCLEVEDKGPGMDAESREHIFKPFYTTRASGTGLGLSITQGIVERHGGRIEVRSEPGEGSTFSVVLPVSADAEAAGG